MDTAGKLLLNPDTIVLSGDLITRETLDLLTEVCNRSIPSEYIPQFVISASLEEYLYEGLYQLAVDRKEI